MLLFRNQTPVKRFRAVTEVLKAATLRTFWQTLQHRILPGERLGYRFVVDISELRHVRIAILATLTLFAAMPVFAHHSTAMYDRTRVLNVTGVVQKFAFTNPHSVIHISVLRDTEVEEWSIEMGSPAHLIRAGWGANTLKAGDKVTVELHPLSAGGFVGLFVSAVGADGKTLGGK